MNPQPTVFISHGSPLLGIEDSPAHRFLIELGKQLERPKAILVISAHWQSRYPAISLTARPDTLYDFSGFPEALYHLKYPAPGATAVAEQAAQLMKRAGLPVTRDTLRGLDHGAWIPLKLMVPHADIPVAQIALLRNAGPTMHCRLGAALQPLREQGVLIIGSGALTHNLYAMQERYADHSPPPWVTEFAEWIADRLHSKDRDALFDYLEQAPYAAKNHPTEEHLLPLFVALGAAGENFNAQRLHSSYTHGVLAMDVYSFGATP
jgi:4,5-DOPA dioxygenase extradiol